VLGVRGCRSSGATSSYTPTEWENALLLFGQDGLGTTNSATGMHGPAQLGRHKWPWWHMVRRTATLGANVERLVRVAWDGILRGADGQWLWIWVALQQQHTAAPVSGISSLGGRHYVGGMEASCFLDHLCLKILCPSVWVKAVSSVCFKPSGNSTIRSFFVPSIQYWSQPVANMQLAQTIN